MSRQKASSDLIVGGEPRVDLLPTEVRIARRGAVVRRGLIGVLFVCVLVVVGGYFFASMRATAASNQLSAEQNKTTVLLTQQQKYAAVRQATAAIASVKAAGDIGVSTEVDWAKLLQDVTAQLPGTIGSVTIDSASPIKPFGQPTTPLAVGRIATLTVIANVPNIPAANSWVSGLSAITGVSDVSVTSVQSQDGKALSETVIIAVDKKALKYPLAKENK